MAIAYVQTTPGDSGTSSPVTSTAFGAATSAGQLVAVAVATDGTVSSVTDSLGNTYSRAFTATGPVTELWISVIATGGSGHTVSAAWTGGTRCAIVAQSFSGLTGGSPLDVYVTATGTSTSPSSGATSTPSTSSSLVIAVAGGTSATPTAVTLGPALTLGTTTVGGSTDSNNSNHLSATKFTTGSIGGLVSGISVYGAATLGTAPFNTFQAGIYADSAGAPGALIANSSNGTLTASTWCTVAISAVLAPSTSYWLGYNSNGSSAQNNLRYANGGTSAFRTGTTTYGTWPNPFGAHSTAGINFSIYATFTEYSNLGAVAAADCNLGMCSKVISAATAQTGTMTLASSQGWACGCAVLKETSTSGPSIATQTGMFLVV